MQAEPAAKKNLCMLRQRLTFLATAQHMQKIFEHAHSLLKFFQYVLSIRINIFKNLEKASFLGRIPSVHKKISGWAECAQKNISRKLSLRKEKICACSACV
jgi:hypothetical protein